MEICRLKILDGKHNSEKGILNLQANILHGKLNIGDCIFLREDYFSLEPYQIQDINKKKNSIEVSVSFPEADWMWANYIKPHIENEDDTVFCGMSVESFLSLSIVDKKEYFECLVNEAESKRVKDYIKSNLLLANKLCTIPFEGRNRLSKVGGLPVAPPTFKFPVDEKGQSMLFLCQVSLEDISNSIDSFPLSTTTGALYFFSPIEGSVDDPCTGYPMVVL
jgi:hypothetical protein